MTTNPKDETPVKATPKVAILDDKTINLIERTIKKIDPHATVDSVIARMPFSQVPEGQKCITCGYVNNGETAVCSMCDTAGQVVLTIKRGSESA